MTAIVETRAERKKKCLICDGEMLAGDETCPSCKAPQEVPCLNCKKPIPVGAKLCSICKTYQRWWRYLSELASAVPILSIIALVSGVYTAYTYLADRNSHTILKVTGSDTNLIYLKVWNTGRKPSSLVGYHLKFAALSPSKEMSLQQVEDEITHEVMNVIIPGKDPVSIKLGLPVFSPEDPQNNAQYSKDELKSLGKEALGDIPVTLQIDVEESNDDGTTHQRQDRFRASRIDKLVTRLTQ